MKIKHFKLLLIASSVCCATSLYAADKESVNARTLAGQPMFAAGELGKLSASANAKAIQQAIANYGETSLKGNESFTIKRQWRDQLGKTHIKLAQKINGLAVYGTSISIHTDAKNLTKGLQKNIGEHDIYAISGVVAHAAPTSNQTSSKFAASATNDKDRVIELAKELGEVTSAPEQVYVYLPLTEQTKQAWKVEVTWNNGGEDFGRDWLFYDASSLELLTRHAQVHSAKNWKTYDLQNQDQQYAPGQLLCSNNQNCGDTSAQRAHDGAAKVYDYYKSRFNRNGINNSDMTMISSVHLGYNVANAYWTGSQMLYGDGDGQQLDDLTLSFDVIGHELTHGVTQHTANLVYNNASGALNEAWSDIMGVAAKAYRDNTTQADWYLAEESYTPGVGGDAMRYMNNPTQDNYSKDWWPERIPYVSNPNNSNDQGGVHGNSGIANLAFALLVDGGQHPRNKSNATVNGIGLLKAEQIFYRALTTYMNQSTNFAGARSATAQAAADLYGDSEKASVETAWCAVGVGACPTTGGTVETLQNGVAKTNISGAEKAEMMFVLDVPAGATDLSFTTSGGTGDADLYVRYGNEPTLSVSDCSSTTPTSSENCDISNVQAGKYYVMVQAWNQISGVSLTGSYQTGGGTVEPISETVTGVSVAAGAWTRYTYELAAGYQNMNIAISGGSGDADLYVTYGQQSSTNNYDCRPWKGGNNESCSFTNPSSGTWHIDIYGYSSASGVTLSLTANP